jgi:hypothetical protein
MGIYGPAGTGITVRRGKEKLGGWIKRIQVATVRYFYSSAVSRSALAVLHAPERIESSIYSPNLASALNSLTEISVHPISTGERTITTRFPGSLRFPIWEHL